jgi:hypothetical protein
MVSLRAVTLSLSCGLAGLAGAAEFFGENPVQAKIALPNGETYIKGASNPVLNLNVTVTLTNKTKKEDLAPETITVPDPKRLSTDEIIKLDKMTAEEHNALLDKLKSGTRQIEQRKVNPESLGVAYLEPQLGPHDSIEFVITKLPEEGETVPENYKAPAILRDNKPESVSSVDMAPRRYLAAGENSPEYSLPVGNYYLIQEPGLYSIKAVIKTQGDNAAGLKVVTSNEEKFRVLPFKVVPQRLEYLKNDLRFYERGEPTFKYMVYQVRTETRDDELWTLQRIMVRGLAQWEWRQICTVKGGTQAQVALLGKDKIAVLAVQKRGNQGHYELDLSQPGVKITKAEIKDLAEGATPKLRVEGGASSVE